MKNISQVLFPFTDRRVQPNSDFQCPVPSCSQVTRLPPEGVAGLRTDDHLLNLGLHLKGSRGHTQAQDVSSLSLSLCFSFLLSLFDAVFFRSFLLSFFLSFFLTLSRTHRPGENLPVLLCHFFRFLVGLNQSKSQKSMNQTTNATTVLCFQNTTPASLTTERWDPREPRPLLFRHLKHRCTVQQAPKIRTPTHRVPNPHRSFDPSHRGVSLLPDHRFSV